MELIPILSTIILVATISTFLLAIGAYVLYKVRERRGPVAEAPHQSEVRAEIVAPAQVSMQRPQEAARPVQRAISAENQPMVYQPQGQVNAQQAGNHQRPQPFTAYNPQPAGANMRKPGQYDQSGYVQQRGLNEPQHPSQFEEKRQQQKDSKFFKYTSEGYVSAKDKKESGGAARWR